MTDASDVEYRALRRSDLSSYYEIIPHGLGTLERSTGLDEMANALVRSLDRRSVWTMLSILRAIGRAPITTFVGASSDGVLGTASVLMLEKSGYVLGVATLPSARNRGIATRLMEMTREEAERRGRSRMALDVEADNERAMRIYRKAGYEEVSNFDWYVGEAPPMVNVPADGAEVLGRTRLDRAIGLVNDSLPPAIRDALPASARRVSHLEFLVQSNGSRVRTWGFGDDGKIVGITRGIFVPLIKTAFLIPLPFGSESHAGVPESYLSQPAEWAAGQGALRTVAIMRRGRDGLEPSGPPLGLTKTVTTVLMIRPSSARSVSQGGTQGGS